MPKTRVCRSCGSTDVTSKGGPPVCAGCKAPNYRPVDATTRPCFQCGSFDGVGTRGKALCQACRRKNNDEANQRHENGRRSRSVTCPQCSKEWITRSGNLVCNSCQHELRKHPCEDCGAIVDKRAKRCLACAAKLRRGDKAPNSKGGRTFQTHSGYVLVLARDHPRAGAHGSGYVREHVLVMEEALGRYLLPGENVHHRNGVKTDNRIENLELWVKSQPAGQRVEDIADWAVELLTRYRPHLLRSPLTSSSHVSGDMLQVRG